ncbi:MAG TPA: ABC transporter permease [Anaeromyxobacteraceae bacterium]|nr:ABC transporter permease [Anaeromyxobacteraceae bacterium]
MRARLDALRVLLRIAFRNLVASRVRTVIIGLIVLVGALVVVVGASMMESIDRGMRTSIQGSLGGQLQVYAAGSEGQLELYGGLRGESLLDPIEDFSKVKEVLSKVPNVRMVVPMGIDQALVATGNAFDVALEKMRADVRRLAEAPDDAEARRGLEARKAHVRKMVWLLGEELQQARVLVDPNGKDAADRRTQREDLDRATSAAFWDGFDGDRFGALEFLENKVAPLAMDSGFTFIRYVGTDVDAFMKAFDLAEVAEGRPIPHGQRGILLGKQYAEEWLKQKNARRLDQIKEKRDRFGARIAKEEELQRWVKDAKSRVREILLQLDPIQSEAAAAKLRPALGAPDGEQLPALLARLFDLTDENFERHYRIFYDQLAPFLRLYQISVGDTITIKAPGKTGAFNSVNVKVYGFIQYKGIEKSGIAGGTSVMDLQTFRDLYGYVTKDKAEELAALRTQMGATDLSRDEAEAALFGGGAPKALEATERATAIDERSLLAGVAEKRRAAEAQATRVYGQDEIDHGVALNAAILLEDPTKLRESQAAVQAAADAAGLKLKVVDWEAASGMVGQFVLLLRGILVFAVIIFFGVALVIINNAMVMAALQRVKEIGTMRAIGAQRGFVVWMLLAEIVAVSLVFGLLGALLGGGVVGLIRGAGGIPATTDLLYFLFSGPSLLPTIGGASVGASLALVLAVSIASALYPAFIAMRVTPVEAMSTED